MRPRLTAATAAGLLAGARLSRPTSADLTPGLQLRLERQREEGRSWAEVLGGADAGHLLRRVRSSGRRLATATGDLMRSLARELHTEGLSHRKIGRLLGVTHQRVTTILKSRSSR